MDGQPRQKFWQKEPLSWPESIDDWATIATVGIGDGAPLSL